MAAAAWTRSALIGAALLLPSAGPAVTQGLGPDSASVEARAALTPSVSDWKAPRSVGRDTLKKGRSRLGAAGLGFLAGAAAGLVIAHLVNESQDVGGGKLENYIGIPLGLGVFTFATVLVATGD